MAKNITATKFRVYLSSLSAKMRENESFGTARNYDRARDSFARFLKYEKIDDAFQRLALTSFYAKKGERVTENISVTLSLWCWQELNRRHMDFQSIALPPELQHLIALTGMQR